MCVCVSVEQISDDTKIALFFGHVSIHLTHPLLSSSLFAGNYSPLNYSVLLFKPALGLFLLFPLAVLFFSFVYLKRLPSHVLLSVCNITNKTT